MPGALLAASPSWLIHLFLAVRCPLCIVRMFCCSFWGLRFVFSFLQTRSFINLGVSCSVFCFAFFVSFSLGFACLLLHRFFFVWSCFDVNLMLQLCSESALTCDCCSVEGFLCEISLIFSSLWTLFSPHRFAGFESDRFDVCFNTWCKEAKTTFSEDLIFELLTIFVFGTSWSRAICCGVLNQNVFYVWLKAPSAAFDSNLVSQILTVQSFFFLLLTFFLPFFEVLRSTVLKIVAVQAVGSVICRTRLTRCFVSKLFDFQLFVNVVCAFLLSQTFWVRPFWRLI